MTDKDFARIKARFPALRWRRADNAAYAKRGGYTIIVAEIDGDWVGGWANGTVGAQNLLPPARPTTLGQALRQLECAILREARTLAGMVGQGVAL